MKKYEIRFINHASFSIEWETELTLMDPWYSGRIFNNAWSLLKETNLEDIQGIEKINSIVISHEHPDHLHFPTLKTIREKYPENKITVYFPARRDPNVQKAIEKMGFNFQYLQPSKPIKVSDKFSLCSFPTGHDSGLIFDLNGTILFNQNDAYFSDQELLEIKNQYPFIDYWWMQFSLAGYYANKGNKEDLQKKGHDFHVERFKHYQSTVKPKVSIPFASFCYFCKYYNSYINDYVVKPWELASNGYTQRTLFYHENLEISKTDSDSKWEDIYSANRKIDPKPDKTNLYDILKAANALFDLIEKPHGPAGYFLLYDYPDIALYIDFTNKHISITNRTHDPNLTGGITSSEELCSYLKFPFGADTLNITGCFEIKNEQVWKSMLQFRDSLYKRKVEH